MPLFSVIVPTYERPALLEQCLRALAAQDIGPGAFEVIVVDDGSTESPHALVPRFADALDLRLLVQSNAGPATARNAGAAAARGEYIVFTDDDCLPDARWLSVLARTVTAHPGSAVGGRVENALGDALYSTASQLLIEFLYDYYNSDASGGRFFITSNLAFPTARFRTMGGFDATFPLAAAEDRDLCDRWREQGHAMVYAGDAVVRHAHALGPWSFCRQHFTYGRGAYFLQCARNRRGIGPVRVEPAGFYWRLVRFPLARRAGPRAVALAALALVSQGMYLSGYLLERVGSRGRRAALRPPPETASS